MNKLYVVGIGPGKIEYMTEEAIAAMKASDILCGYTVYIDLVKPYFPDKEFFSTPMRGEVERCRWAVDEAEKGKNIAVISSGDAGVYGMAGLILEIADGRDVEVEVVSGTTAALSGAAILGAPLMNDFAVISLSDLMTPGATIEKRIRAAGEGDFSIVFYNPRSTKRTETLARACDILMESRSPETVCGYVRNIGRDGQEKGIMTLKELRTFEADMVTTVFIGNSQTKCLNGRMVTPRGYEVVR